MCTEEGALRIPEMFAGLRAGRARKRRTLSAAARRKMSLAQKARWARRTLGTEAPTARPKRTLSVAARRKIAAAQRARWAKVRAKQQKKAFHSVHKLATQLTH